MTPEHLDHRENQAWEYPVEIDLTANHEEEERENTQRTDAMLERLLGEDNGLLNIVSTSTDSGKYSFSSLSQ